MRDKKDETSKDYGPAIGAMGQLAQEGKAHSKVATRNWGKKSLVGRGCPSLPRRRAPRRPWLGLGWVAAGNPGGSVGRREIRVCQGRGGAWHCFVRSLRPHSVSPYFVVSQVRGV